MLKTITDIVFWELKLIDLINFDFSGKIALKNERDQGMIRNCM